MTRDYEKLIPAATELARRVSGQIKIRGWSVLHVAGVCENLPVRIRLRKSVDVDYAVDVRMATARRPLFIRQAPEPAWMRSKGWDEWDLEDGEHDEEQRLYITDHVCHEGTDEAIEGSQLVWQSLPDEVQRYVIQLLEEGGGFVRWRNTRLTIDPWEETPLSEVESAAMKLIEFSVWLAHSLEKLHGGYR